MTDRRMILTATVLAATMTVWVAAPARAVSPSEYLVVFKSEKIDPARAQQLIERAGGEILRPHFEIGVAVVASDDLHFVDDLAAHPSVLAVERDLKVRALGPGLTTADEMGVVRLSDPIPTSLEAKTLRSGSSLSNQVGREIVTDPTQARLFDRLQWALRRIQAPEAWALGHLGDPAVTVAILDTGIDYTHPEIADRIDLENSVSFVPEEDEFIEENFPEGTLPIADLHFHGTFNAGVIACNAINTACVAPNVTVVAVKVVNRRLEVTAAETVSGILHAVSIGADVINMAFNFVISFDTEEERAGYVAVRRAIDFAFQSGALVVAEAGLGTSDDFTPIDADNDGNDRIMPAQAGAFTVSATSIGDLWSQFNHFGTSLVDIAAPGGRFPDVFDDFENNLVWGPCSRFSLLVSLQGCKISPRSVSVLGSIPAATHVSGLAALIDSKVGGALSGRQLQEIIIATADDIGEPGFDALFGDGRINVLSAVTAPLPED